MILVGSQLIWPQMTQLGSVKSDGSFITYLCGSCMQLWPETTNCFGGNNISRDSYFNRIHRLWNALPVINLNYFINISNQKQLINILI